MRDIALPRKIREDLKPSEGKYKKYLEDSFNHPLYLNCIVGLDGNFKHPNPIPSKILGYTEKELLSVPFVECIHPEDREGSLTEMEKLSKGGKINW